MWEMFSRGKIPYGGLSNQETKAEVVRNGFHGVNPVHFSLGNDNCRFLKKMNSIYSMKSIYKC